MTDDELRGRWLDLRAEVDRLGGPGITIIAVTKGHPVELAQQVAAAGIVDLGESYAQELVAKAPLVSGVRWHLIGRLQRNKVRSLAPLVALWHSVDRSELGTEIARRAPGASVLVQVNATGEMQKGGCPPEDVPRLVDALRADDLDVRGLMTVGVAGDDRATADAFSRTSSLAEALALPVRSMGMSDDWRIAVEHGATMLRIGRTLVGARPDPRDGDRRVGH